MSKHKISPQKIILVFTCILFGFFLLLPMVTILCKSFYEDGNATLEFYGRLFSNGSIFKAFGNSILVSSLSGIITTVLAFIPAYAINYTNINRKLKKMILTLVMLPMLLPTITYGFAIIYSFGKHGLITKLLGRQLVDIYGIAGLIIGYVIYTLPISFMLINNTMGYIDKKFMIVSRMMGDGKLKCFFATVITPLISTLAVSFIQSFTLSFTDYGIPAALAGNVDLLATRLYNEMLGSLPDFNTGSAVSIIMLLPSVASIILISVLNKYNIRYNKISVLELTKKRTTFIVDAMSSFGGVDIEVERVGIDYIISSANKCIQGVPGFSFIICKKSELEKCEGNAVSLSLDLYDQWRGMDKDGKWRFTSPTHVVLAFAKALEELEAEDGVKARFARYAENNRMLIEKMTGLGFRTYLDNNQSPIITTFLYPDTADFSFEQMYKFIKERGYAIYPGKVTDADVFRIGNIGEIYPEDIEKLCGIFADFLGRKG